MQGILRQCPICSQDSIIGHGRRRKQAHDQHHAWIGIRRGLCSRCARRSPSCRPFLLPTAITASSPAARRCSAVSWKAVPGKLRHPPSKTPIAWPILLRCADGAKPGFFSAAVFFPARDGPGCRRVAHQNRDSRARFAALALAHRIPVSRSVLALADLEKSAAHHSCLGKRLSPPNFDFGGENSACGQFIHTRAGFMMDVPHDSNKWARRAGLRHRPCQSETPAPE